MEINVVFTHELVKADVIGVQPPLFPLRRIAGSDTWVSDAGIKLWWWVISHPSVKYWPVLTQTSERDISEGNVTAIAYTPYREPSPSCHTDPLHLRVEQEHPKSSLESQGLGVIHP